MVGLGIELGMCFSIPAASMNHPSPGIRPVGGTTVAPLRDARDANSPNYDMSVSLVLKSKIWLMFMLFNHLSTNSAFKRVTMYVTFKRFSTDSVFKRSIICGLCLNTVCFALEEESV